MQIRLNKHRAIRLLAGCIVAAAVVSEADATDYYVDQANPNAADQNSGSEVRPWKTISKANSTLLAGDTVHIKAGTYTTYVAPTHSGTATQRITYTNYSNDVVTIRDASYGVLIDGKSYITVHGLNFTNLDRFMYVQ